jgi:hypothetical protein
MRVRPQHLQHALPVAEADVVEEARLRSVLDQQSGNLVEPFFDRMIQGAPALSIRLVDRRAATNQQFGDFNTLGLVQECPSVGSRLVNVCAVRDELFRQPRTIAADGHAKRGLTLKRPARRTPGIHVAPEPDQRLGCIKFFRTDGVQ